MSELHRRMEAAGMSHSTRRLTQTILHMAWVWAHGHDLVQVEAPAKRRMSSKDRSAKKKAVPTLDQALTAIALVAEPWRSILTMQLATGARIGEVCGLQVGDIFEDGGQTFVRVGAHVGARKTGEREIPVTSPMGLRALRQASAAARLAGRDRLWIGPKGGKVTPSGTSGQLRRVDWTRVGCEPFITHALRYLAVLMMRQADIRPELAAELLGHSVAVMMGVYSSIDRGELVNAMERVRLGERGIRIVR